jgi:hypothetical protein
MPVHKFPIAPRIPSMIFLNGPAGSGKSTIADHLVSLDRGFTVHHHASPLWTMLDAIVGVDPTTDEPYDFNDPAVKAAVVPNCQPGFASPTFREALISIGKWTRDTFGPETLSRLAADAAADYLRNFDSVIFPAVRTQEDLSCLIDPNIASSEYLLIRLFRKNCDWYGDLGGYLDIPRLGIPSVDIVNDGTPEELLAHVLGAIGVYENV